MLYRQGRQALRCRSGMPCGSKVAECALLADMSGFPRLPKRGSLYCMRMSGPILVVVFALAVAAVSYLLDDGFAKVASLQRSVEQQRRANSKLAEGVEVLKREVTGLQSDPRVVEKAARSELGMVRPDEMIVIFEKKQGESHGASR